MARIGWTALGFLALSCLPACVTVRGSAVDQHYQRLALRAGLEAAPWPASMSRRAFFLAPSGYAGLDNEIVSFLQQKFSCRRVFEAIAADTILVPRVEIFGLRLQTQDGPLLLVQTRRYSYESRLSLDLVDPHTQCAEQSLSLSSAQRFKEVSVLGGLHVAGPSETLPSLAPLPQAADAIRKPE